MKKMKFLKLLLALFAASAFSQTAPDNGLFTIARLKYGGGGDWYNNPSTIPNMHEYLRTHTLVQTAVEEVKVALDDEKLFFYPVLFMTGHGRVFFTDRQVERLQLYLQSGGFLYVDDDYGMDKHIRRELNKVFPDNDLVEIPFSHPIFHIHYNFPNGLPKIHEHDGGPPSAWGVFIDGRLAVFYTANTNISDGWPDPEVHNDPPNIREAAFKMGTNVFIYAMTQ